MRRIHIALIVESAHGHINPTLGITSRLVGRGYRVTYAIKEYFAPRVLACGGEPKIYRPLEAKLTVFRDLQEYTDGEFPFDMDRVDVKRYSDLLEMEREGDLAQLESLYIDDRPDLIVYDRTNLPGRALALKWNIAAVEHSPMMIPADIADYDAELVIVSLPEFFQKNAETLGSRFHFVGPSFSDYECFGPRSSDAGGLPTILVSATTGLLPQAEFYLTSIQAFKDLPWRIVLSIGDELEPQSLGPLPSSFEINRFSSQQKLLAHTQLFVGHGGPNSIFEALRFGVPLLLIPPSQVHDQYARRVEELGLGIRLQKREFSAEKLRKAAVSLLCDAGTTERVNEIRNVIRESNGARDAADLIERYINSSRR